MCMLPCITWLDLLAVVVPLHLSLWIVHLALKVHLPLCLSLQILQALRNSILRVGSCKENFYSTDLRLLFFGRLTFNFEVAFARQVVALSNCASVTSSVFHLWVLDGQSVRPVLLVCVHRVLWTLVALL